MDTSTDDRSLQTLPQDNGTPQPLGEEFQVNTYIDDRQSFPSVATLADGGFVVTWTSGDYDSRDIYAQRYDAEGNALGGEFQVNTYTNSQQEFPSVATLADGGFVVTWNSYDYDQYELFGEVYGQLYDGTATPVGEEFRVNTYTQNPQTRPSVTGLRDGGFVVTWHSDGQDGSGHGVYGQLYDGTGTTVGEEFQVNTYTLGGQYYPSVTGLRDGGFVVTWASDQDDGSSSGVYGQLYDDSGNTVGEEFQVNTYTDGRQDGASVAALADGGFVVTWHSDWQDGSSSGVYGQLFYDGTATPVGEEFRVNTYTQNAQSYPSVTGLRDGGFVVTWISDGQDGSSYGVYGQRFSSELYDGLLAPYFLTLPENSDTTNRIKVANIITITDDILATSNITLSGSDVANFEVDGSELFLRAGTNLDFETKDSYSVTVEIDYPEEGTTPDVTTDFNLYLSNNEPPTAITLQDSLTHMTSENLVVEIAENSYINNRIKLARVCCNTVR